MSEPMRAEGCACGVTSEHGPHERELPELLAWRVTADGDTIATFDNFDDAEGMASAWNTAYPHEPWFKVVADLPASTPEASA